MPTIRIRLEPQGRELSVKGPRTVRSLLHQLDIPLGTVLVIRKSQLLPEDELVANGDEVEIRSVISGGQQ